MQNHNPSSVWAVPDSFRTIYTHAREERPGFRQLHVSGQVGVIPDGVMRPDFANQLEAAVINVQTLLASAGMGRGDMVKSTFFLTRSGELPALGDARRQQCATDMPAAATVIVVTALARADALIEGEVTAATAT